MNSEVSESKSPDRAWLRAMAAAEDRSKSVSVGGLAQSLGMTRALRPERALPVLGRLIQLARRSRRLTIEDLAREARVPLGDLVAIERDEQVVPDPLVVSHLAGALGLSVHELHGLLGLGQPCDERLREAAVRFRARPESSEMLSSAEEAALMEFSGLLAEVPRNP